MKRIRRPPSERKVRTYRIAGCKVVRRLPVVEPGPEDIQVVREENGCGGHHYVTSSIPLDWREDRKRLTVAYSTRPRVLRDARTYQDRTGARLLRRSRLGWTDEPCWWSLSLTGQDEARVVAALQDVFGLGLRDARLLARTLATRLGEALRVPFAHAESTRARGRDLRQFSMLQDAGLLIYEVVPR